MANTAPRFRGYAMVVDNGKLRLYHRVVAERALGKPLPFGAEVHHVESDINERGGRYVICQDRAYHRLLHQRERVLRAGGNPNTDAVCARCKRVRSLTDFNKNKAQRAGRCAACRDCTRAQFNAWRSRQTA